MSSFYGITIDYHDGRAVVEGDVRESQLPVISSDYEYIIMAPLGYRNDLSYVLTTLSHKGWELKGTMKYEKGTQFFFQKLNK
jgi:hypothetical protein